MNSEGIVVVSRRTLLKCAAAGIVLGAVELTRPPGALAAEAIAPPAALTAAGLAPVLVPGVTQAVDAPVELGVALPAGRGLTLDRGATLTFRYDPRLYELDPEVTAETGDGPVPVTVGPVSTDPATGLQSLTVVVDRPVMGAFVAVAGHLRPRAYPLDIVRDAGGPAVTPGGIGQTGRRTQMLGRDRREAAAGQPWGCEAGALWQPVEWGDSLRSYCARSASAFSTGPGAVPAGYRLRVTADSALVRNLEALGATDSAGRPMRGKARRADEPGLCRVEWTADAPLPPGERAQVRLGFDERPPAGPLPGIRHPVVEVLPPAGAAATQRTTYLETVVRADSVYDEETRRRFAGA